MFTPGFDHMLYYEMHHKELLQEAQRHRLVQEALKSRPPERRYYAKILAAIDILLVSLGNSLEERYSTSPQIEILQQGICE